MVESTNEIVSTPYPELLPDATEPETLGKIDSLGPLQPQAVKSPLEQSISDTVIGLSNVKDTIYAAPKDG